MKQKKSSISGDCKAMDSVDEYMKGAFSKVRGEEVKGFEDYREARKKRKKKKKVVESEKNDDIISNDEGFSIVSNPIPKFVDFSDGMKKSGWKHDPNRKLDDWNTFDFFYYTYRLYANKYNKEWDLNMIGNSQEIIRIRNLLDDKFGSVNNLLVKDFIIFFFENLIDSLCVNKKFYFSYLKRRDVIDSFYNSYDYKNNLRQFFDKKIESDEIVSHDAINKAFMVSETNLLCKYGLVIAVNWFVSKQKWNEDDAKKTVYAACVRLKDKGILRNAINATERHSPYPSWLLFKEPKLLIDRISPDLEVNIEFIESEKNSLDFLKLGGYNTKHE